MTTLKQMIEDGTMNHDPRPRGDFKVHGTRTGRFPAKDPKRSQRPKRPPRKSTLMYRSAKALQQRYRKALKALRVAKGIIEYVPPEVHERDDWLSEQKKLFAEHCDDFRIK